MEGKRQGSKRDEIPTDGFQELVYLRHEGTNRGEKKAIAGIIITETKEQR